jgi:two-component system, OmpR family, copper resistance phosphate regulon response regulator CusR
MRILIAEGNLALATFLQRSFQDEHYLVDLAADGTKAKILAEDQAHDAAVLDLNIPMPDRLDVLKHVRASQPQLPILILANHVRPEDRARVFNLGADDLVLKPFAFSELAARVRALLRRGGRSPQIVLRIEDLELSRVDRTVKRAGRAIELTPKEFALLEYLMRNAGQHVTRAQITEHVWNVSFDTMTNVVDVYINYLRKKVDAFSERKLILTIRGVGYQIQENTSGKHAA